MMNKKRLCTSLVIASLPSLSYATDYFSLKDGDGFKRFSVSAGWLHVMPQGKANNFVNSTAIAEGTTANVGRVTTASVLNAIDTSTPEGVSKKNTLQGYLDFPLTNALITENINGKEYLRSSVSGTATLNGLSSWESENTGLTAQNVDTLGLLSNYYFTDHLSVQLVGGIPPKVDIKGQGQILAPLSGTNSPSGIGVILGDIPLRQDLFISDLSAPKTVATARAWTPALQLQYQFGKSGQNKFRPYVGAGVMYGYFNQLKMNNQTEADLIAAGHKIQNILDGNAGRALDGELSSADPRIKLKTSDSFAPMLSAGFTYDFNDRWFSTASVSYAKLSSDITIDVVNNNTGTPLIQGKTKIDIDPLLSYIGVGYRF